MVLTMGRNLTPIMLALGPLLLLVAFAMFPLQDQIGQNAMDALVDEDRSFMMMLLVVGTFGVTLIFGGLNLLIKDMKKNTDGMNAQLLSYAKVLMIVALVCFFQGFGGYVAAINAFETEIDESEVAYYPSEADRETSARAAWESGNAGWALLTVAWGIGLIVIGLTAYLMQRPEQPAEYLFTALMPLGTILTILPILNDSEVFGGIFPIALIIHLAIGGLMLSGNLEVPGSRKSE